MIKIRYVLMLLFVSLNAMEKQRPEVDLERQERQLRSHLWGVQFDNAVDLYKESKWHRAFNLFAELTRQIDRADLSIKARFYLAKMYYYGNGIEQNYRQAFVLFKKAAEEARLQNLNIIYWESLRFIADMNYFGQDLPVDREQAMELYRYLATQIDDTALKAYGFMRLAEIYYEAHNWNAALTMAQQAINFAAPEDDMVVYMQEMIQNIQQN